MTVPDKKAQYYCHIPNYAFMYSGIKEIMLCQTILCELLQPMVSSVPMR